MDEPVYQEWRFEDIPSSHGNGIAYHVFFGTVNWTKIAGDERTAFVVLMKYDGKLAYGLPAHIIEDDAPAVFAAVERLRAWRAANSA